MLAARAPRIGLVATAVVAVGIAGLFVAGRILRRRIDRIVFTELMGELDRHHDQVGLDALLRNGGALNPETSLKGERVTPRAFSSDHSAFHAGNGAAIGHVLAIGQGASR